jgi:hypothetical protein
MINTILGRYLSVTAEQIRDVAAAVFREDNRVVLTYLPAAGSAGTGEGTDATEGTDDAAAAGDEGEAQA